MNNEIDIPKPPSKLKLLFMGYIIVFFFLWALDSFMKSRMDHPTSPYNYNFMNDFFILIVSIMLLSNLIVGGTPGSISELEARYKRSIMANAMAAVYFINLTVKLYYDLSNHKDPYSEGTIGWPRIIFPVYIIILSVYRIIILTREKRRLN